MRVKNGFVFEKKVVFFFWIIYGFLKGAKIGGFIGILGGGAGFHCFHFFAKIKNHKNSSLFSFFANLSDPPPPPIFFRISEKSPIFLDFGPLKFNAQKN